MRRMSTLMITSSFLFILLYQIRLECTRQRQIAPYRHPGKNGVFNHWRQVTSPVLVPLSSRSRLSEQPLLFLPPRLRAYRGFSTRCQSLHGEGVEDTPTTLPFTTLPRRTGSPRAHLQPLATNSKTTTLVQSQLAPPEMRERALAIRASAGDAPTADCWEHPSHKPSWHTMGNLLSAGDTQPSAILKPSLGHPGSHLGTQWASCPSVGDNPTSRHLGTQWASCPSVGDTPTSRHLGTEPGTPREPSWHSTDTCPSVEDFPTSSHLGAQRTRVPLPGTHQPCAIKALQPSWHSTRPGTANAGDCPTRGQRSQTLSASVRLWALLPHTFRPLATTPTHCAILHGVELA